MTRLVAPLLLCGFLGALPGGSAQAATLTVFAASSLTDAFTEIGRAFQSRTGHKATFQFAGSQTLRAQLERGARADVYASANAAQFDPLVRAGLVHPGAPFASNWLAVIVPVGRTTLRTLPDLVRPGVKLVVADRAVPAGEATRRMLAAIDHAGTYGRDYSARFLHNVASEEPNVRQVALKVQLGEADAAVVYASDVTPTLKRAVRVLPLPSRFNARTDYLLGTVSGSAQPEAARAFAAFVRSGEGQRILKKWGFGAAQNARAAIAPAQGGGTP